MQKLKRYPVKVVMLRPYCDSWLHKPSNDDVLETLANLILQGQLDDHFIVEVKEEP